MTKQVINVGTSPNSKNGDPLRTAFIKINENFNEVYLALTDNLNFEQVNSDWNATTGVARILNKPTIPLDVSDLTDTQGLLVGGTANTGDVTFSGIKVIGAGTASGDGNGYSTLELVPDNNLYGNDQYLVIDPTTPSHIHIRAGGTQDNSQSTLILGGERTNVELQDNSSVLIKNDRLINTTAYFSSPADFQQDIADPTEGGSWITDSGFHYITFSTTNSNLQSFIDGLNQRPESFIEILVDGSYVRLNPVGYAGYLGDPRYFRIQVDQAPVTSPTVFTGISITNYNIEYNRIGLDVNDFYVGVQNSIDIYANSGFNLTTGTGNIKITANDNDTSPTWYFTAQGYTQFPQDVAPLSSKGQEGDEIGSVVFNGSYIYYCTADYSDGLADIWKRVSWSNDTW